MEAIEHLTTLFLNTENEYIEKFHETYRDDFNTPDGFTICCKYLEATAKHFCCGKNGSFQKTRAQRILWAKYILLNPNERIILTDTTTNNIIFFFTKHSHCIICRKLGEKLNLISSFIASGKRKNMYKNGKPPFIYYIQK
jgi:hypothetical protein